MHASMRFHRPATFFLAALLALAIVPLTACGGGGDGDGDDVIPPPPPANQIPTASFTASPLAGTAPLLVSFDASASSDPDGSIAAYAWNFGDGGTASGLTATHTYAVAGNYTARLTVTDDVGAMASASRDIVVTSGTTPPPANQAPTASFTASPLSGTAPLPVSFDASGSTDPDGSITTYAWTFGDGAIGSGRTAAHTYAVAGTYTAQLTITDDDGATASASRDIVVTSGTTPSPNAQWLGRYESSLIAEAPVYAEIVQTGTTLSGIFRDDTGRTGTLAGVISGTTATLTINETTPDCAGSFVGTGTLGSVGRTGIDRLRLQRQRLPRRPHRRDGTPDPPDGLRAGLGTERTHLARAQQRGAVLD